MIYVNVQLAVIGALVSSTLLILLVMLVNYVRADTGNVRM